jgi:hypothetical protein
MKSELRRPKGFEARGLLNANVIGEVQVDALRHIEIDIHERQFVVLLSPSDFEKSRILFT